LKLSARILLIIQTYALLFSIPSTLGSPTLMVNVQTDKPSYYSGEDINVYGLVLLNGVPLENATVAIEIRDPAATPIVVQSVQTNSSGAYQTMFRLSQEASAGEYSIFITCAYGGETANSNGSFQLKKTALLAVAIMTGKESYTVEENVTITGDVTLNNIKLPQALVALEVQDPNAIPVIVRVLETDSQGEYALTFPISPTSALGMYTAFASTTYNESTAAAETSFALQPSMSSADINQDGTVNILDLAIVARAWGSYPGHPHWDPRCDVNGDSKINIIDITLVAKEYQP
jgi:uncharacterized protein YfaS (alpha-2-macroglobulin family)